ncbi:hypothetical protein FACS1894217_05060 [Clostridia bacterium]|nr:hypothetical protein FACS1894217_05060 [Clostridia bacterium]
MNTRHGLSKTRLYKIYVNMKSRCYNPKSTRFYSWGGKGITICNDWLEDFKKFYDWSMQNGYSEDLTIDRIDSDKGYSPENCRWVTVKEQSNNTCKNHQYTFNGETLNSCEIAAKYNLKRTTFEERIRRGWSLERALLSPVRCGNGK